MPSERMRWSDFAWLGLFCLVLFSFPLFNNRVLTTHETVHCENAREMRADGDWVIPHYGGRPWTERPPLPFWITAGVVEVFGDSPFAYRLAALLMGVPCVLLVGWLASVWYGRGIGMLSGLVLATMQEFTHYSTGPEADIFLCTIVTAAIALFVRLEFQSRPADGTEELRWLGRRPWAALAFFAVLGLTNLAKGLFFGTLFVVLPIISFLMWNFAWQAIRRYIWLWGWLAFLAVASAWPIAAYLRYPDILDFWKSDYMGRVNQGYMQEPFWYYCVHLLWVVFPWTLAAFFGLWLTRTAAWRQRGSAERFLWCWAIVPILFFSIPQGKHHHYLLQCMAPWAVLAALGTARFWELAKAWSWLHRPWLSERVALSVLMTLLVAVHWLSYACQTHYRDHYRHDRAFLQQACALTPADQAILVMDDDAPLHASWLLFYLEDRATLLHNITFLLDDQIMNRDVYLIARAKVAKDLAQYGIHEVLLASKHSRYEKDGDDADDRYTLFFLRFHERLARHSGPVRISPMQATGRATGPFLVANQQHTKSDAELPGEP
jgi:4-amino-4-deoxy-L-arabinose transferase-like glycosyltransferase